MVGKRIHKSLATGFDMPEKGEEITFLGKGYKVNYIKPCLTDKKNKIVEAKLLNLHVSLRRIYNILKKSGLFDKLDISEKIGIVRAYKDSETITIFDAGRITFKKADNEKNVIDTINNLNRLLRA